MIQRSRSLLWNINQRNVYAFNTDKSKPMFLWRNWPMVEMRRHQCLYLYAYDAARTGLCENLRDAYLKGAYEDMKYFDAMADCRRKRQQRCENQNDDSTGQIVQFKFNVIEAIDIGKMRWWWVFIWAEYTCKLCLYPVYFFKTSQIATNHQHTASKIFTTYEKKRA